MTSELEAPSAPRPASAAEQHEADRLLALASFEILDTPPEASFDDLTELAAHLCEAPISLVTLVEADRQWFKSSLGLEPDLTETTRDLSFCAHALHGPELMVVPDARLDPRFADHPMVTGDPHLRFYAGAPLITPDGYALGALCVLDTVPRSLTDRQGRHLRTLADQVLGQLEVRRQARLIASEMQARLAVHAALRERQQMLDGVLNHTDVMIYAKDLDGQYVMANPVLEHIAQVQGGIVGRSDYDLFGPDLANLYRQNDARIAASGERQVFNEDVVHPDGSTHAYRSTKFPLLDDEGDVIGIGGVSMDVTELVAARAAHEEAEQRWRALVEQSPVAVAVIDVDGLVAYANPQAVTLCGASTAAEIEDRPALSFSPVDSKLDHRAMFEDVFAGGPPLRACRCTMQQVDGIELVVEINATRVTHRGGPAVQVELRDITAAATEREALERFASTDPLTGVLNRRAWDAALHDLLDVVRRDVRPLTIAVVDLDHFKAYNDTHGHNAGDLLLQEFVAAARAVLGSHDVFARWGGEEFILALPGTGLDDAADTLDAVRRCVPAGETCSIGYTLCDPAEDLSATLSRADGALYRAKELGRNRLEMAEQRSSPA